MNELAKDGHMTAAVLYGSEDMKIERVDIPRLAKDEVLVRVAGEQGSVGKQSDLETKPE